jgi:DNA-binding GntR family transcriptional regulator
MFKQIETHQSRLADEVYRQILDVIHLGGIAPRERIVQEKLAKELKVSRTPVREALLRLEQEGVLITAGRSGFTIREVSNEEVRQIYDARAAVDGHAAWIIASSRDPSMTDAIQAVIEREENIEGAETLDYFNANRAIHRAIVEQTGNHYLLEMFDNIWNRGNSFRIFAAIERIDLAKSLGEHIYLCDAMREGTPEAAREAMIKHIADGLDLQLEALAMEQD